MTTATFTFINAVLLSAVAAYYSVIGLAAIFPGSFWPVVLMGSVLESAKLVTASWLYRNWKTAPGILKWYLTSAVAILMLITSMGIFGYLSKAHLEHASDISPVADKVAVLDEKIQTLKQNIELNRKTLNQLDAAVDNVMTRSDSERGAERSIQIRKSQQKERNQLNEEINKTQKEIAKLTEERVPLSVELRKAESDFGPIKYVAELIYGSGEKDIIDKAVRLVIILIMIVFDPLAVLLLIASNISMGVREEKKTKRKDDGRDQNPVYQRVQEAKKKLEERNDPPEEEVPREEKSGPEERSDEVVQVRKENVIVIDEVSGESIPPLNKEPTHEKVETHVSPGLFKVEHVPAKKLEPKYDYDEPLAFKEKDSK
jgi:cell division protein FtsB